MTRMLPTRYLSGNKVAVVKKTRARTAHISPPAKGLSFEARSGTSDAKVAGILTNFYVDDDRISVRAGFKKIATMAGNKSVDHLIPYYGQPQRLAAATNFTFCDAETGALWRSGFTSNDWHWTSFSNLGDREYTIMVNGKDGVFGWDGDTDPQNPTLVTITKIAGTGTGSPPPSNPAQCTVAVADITKFKEGTTVIISGADTAHGKANGPHRISSVNNPANTFSLVGVDLSGAGSDQTTGTMRAQIQGSFEMLGLLPPTGNTWLDPKEFHIVLAHQNRLFFADESRLALYYLPLQQKDGVIGILPLNAIFKKGGTIKAMATWTVDGGMGMDDQICIFTTNGEMAIYSGIDPASDFSLVGVFRSEVPMSKHSVFNYGGELYVFIPTGITPMTAMLRAGKEGLETVDQSIVPLFTGYSVNFRGEFGWSLFLNPSSGRLYANMPLGGGRYDQMIRHMSKGVYSLFKDIPARCWSWINPYVYFGDDLGNVYELHPIHRTDNGKPIRVDVQMAWSQFKTPSLKHFKMVLPYIVTDGFPQPFVDVKVDYDDTPIINKPELSEIESVGATWDTATWDVDSWVGGSRNWANWTGVGSLGRVGAVRLSAQIANCSFAITGFDILYEEGSVFG